MEAASDAIEPDGAGAGLGADFAGACLLQFDIAGAGLKIGRTLDTVSADGAGTGLGLQAGTDLFDVDITGARVGGDGGGAGEGDVVVDADVAVEIVIVVAVADGDLASGLGDGWVGDDLADTGVDVSAAAVHPALVAVDVSVDVNLRVGAGVEVNGAGAGGDGDHWGVAGVEGAIKVCIRGEGCGGGEGQCGVQGDGAEEGAGIHLGSYRG